MVEELVGEMKIPCSEPGSSRKNKTGWSEKIPVISEKCIGCKQCYFHCPEWCIEMINNKASVDVDYCKGCGICESICPVKAIEMKDRKR